MSDLPLVVFGNCTRCPQGRDEWLFWYRLTVFQQQLAARRVEKVRVLNVPWLLQRVVRLVWERQYRAERIIRRLRRERERAERN